MYRLFSLSTLLILVNANPKTPKIYNVLISTKKNLSPSHALPVYEPVLRTASLGIALPPFATTFYQQPFFPYQPTPFINYGTRKESSNNISLKDEFKSEPEEPLQIDQFISYNYSPGSLKSQISYASTSPGTISSPHDSFPNNEALHGNFNDPKSIVANLKRNPEIPDVPPPALPVKNS